MQSENDAQADAVATPQDYLEKIFQIPFTVRPMGKPGFGRLMDRLLTPATEDIELTELAAEGVAPRAGGASQGETPANDSDVTQQLSSEGNIDPSPDVATAPSELKPVELAVPAQALSITPVETEFAHGLYMLLATPRSAKRFANIYRLLKASLSAEALPAFEGRSAVPGTFQLPMLLLALLVGKPQLAAKLFPKFLAGAQSNDDDWWETGWKGLGRSEEEIRSLLAPTVEVGYFPGSPQHAVQWLPQVARYSFMTASIFIKETA